MHRTMHRTMRTTTVVLILAVIFALGSAVQAQAPPKIGVFDSQRISIETAEGQKVQARLEALQESKRLEITAKEQGLEGLQQRLNQQGLSLSAEMRLSMEMDIQRRLLEVNTLRDLSTRELQLEVAAAEAAFNDKLRVVVSQFGRDEGFTVLLEAAAVAWAANSVDVTTALIDIFDRVYPTATE